MELPSAAGKITRRWVCLLSVREKKVLSPDILYWIVSSSHGHKIEIGVCMELYVPLESGNFGNLRKYAPRGTLRIYNIFWGTSANMPYLWRSPPPPLNAIATDIFVSESPH